MQEEAPSTEEATEAPQLSLEDRVAFLEAQNEGLKRVGLLGLVLVMLLGAILVHQTYSDLKSSTTRGLTLLNEKDQLSGAITTDQQGRMQFFQARYGMLAPPADISDDFHGFAFYDSNGVPRVLIGEGKDKETVFLVADPVRKKVFDPFENAKVPTSSTPAASPTPVAPSAASSTPAPQTTPAQP